MEMTFHSRANKTHFHKKGFAPGLILKVRVLELLDAMLLYSRDEWFWIIIMPLSSVQICVSRDFGRILQF